MTTSTQTLARPRGLTVIGVVGFAAAVAAASQIAMVIPGTPVPITLQPMVVILAGMCLGPAAGAARHEERDGADLSIDDDFFGQLGPVSGQLSLLLNSVFNLTWR